MLTLARFFVLLLLRQLTLLLFATITHLAIPAHQGGDEMVTRRLVEAANLMQIRFLDHVVCGTTAPGRAGYYSFREAGLIP